jgi:hypothetical protein
MEPYEPAEHLLAWLRWLDLLLLREVVRLRRGRQEPGDEFQGLYIADADVDRLLGEALGVGPLGDTDQFDAGLERLAEAAHQAGAEIDRRESASAAAGVALPMVELARRFDLTAEDRAILLIVCASDLETRFESLYAYAQDDVTRRWPTGGLVLRLLADETAERWRLRRRLIAQAPLIRHGLVRLIERDGLPFLSRALRVDDRVTYELLGMRGSVDARLESFTQLIEEPSEEPLRGPQAVRAQVREWERLWHNTSPPFEPLAVFEGPAASEAEVAATSLAAGLGRPVLRSSVPGMLASGLGALELVLLVRREALMQDALLLLTDGTWLASEEARVAEVRGALEPLLRELPVPTVIACQGSLEAGALFEGVHAVRLSFPLPGYRDRVEAWCHGLGWQGASLPDADGIGEVAAKFSLSGGQIAAAAALARSLALLGGRHEVSRGDMLAAARAQSHHGLAAMARKIDPVYSWDDIVLPGPVAQQLREVEAAVEHRQTIFVDWGFGERMSRGKGLNVLFSGASGTGKTMAAEVLAHELGLDLYEIDLATIVSKYIGETEKNLRRIFEEAQLSNAILFFDEADALFGKRSQVRDSHDRYANIEIAYLLQLMEEYEGMAILATNLSRNVDDAFARRMHHVIEFPVPNESLRSRIWSKVFPQATPMGDVDLGFAARHFELAGGAIRGAALGAAAMAAADGGSVSMRHLVVAVAREYQKLGRPPSQAEFGLFYREVLERLALT